MFKVAEDYFGLLSAALYKQRRSHGFFDDKAQRTRLNNSCSYSFKWPRYINEVNVLFSNLVAL